MGIIERKTIHIFNIWRLGSVIELRTDGLREPVDAGRHRFRESRRRRSRSVTARRGQLEFINGWWMRSFFSFQQSVAVAETVPAVVIKLNWCLPETPQNPWRRKTCLCPPFGNVFCGNIACQPGRASMRARPREYRRAETRHSSAQRGWLVGLADDCWIWNTCSPLFSAFAFLCFGTTYTHWHTYNRARAHSLAHNKPHSLLLGVHNLSRTFKKSYERALNVQLFVPLWATEAAHSSGTTIYWSLERERAPDRSKGFWNFIPSGSTKNLFILAFNFGFKNDRCFFNIPLF